jgi:anti-sigma factor RsiW
MTTTTHSVAPEDIMAFLDGELSAVEARAVSAHLKDCAQCAMVAEQFRATSEMFSRWDVEAAPASLEDSVAAKAATHRAAVNSRPARFRGRRLLAIGSGAVAVMALLVVAVFFRPSGQSRSSAEFVLADKPIAGYVQPQLSEKMRRPAEPLHALDSRPSAGIVAGEAGMGPPGSGGIAGTGFSGGSDGQLEASSTPAPMIARAAWLVIRVKDVEASRSSLDAILARHHGYPAQLNVTSPEYGARGFQASLRIPAPELSSAIGEIKGLGRLENESQSGEDVTRQHADVAARLKTARETEERFRAILQQRTGKISDVLEVEQSIARVRGEIERMEAEQKTLEHRVDFASVEIQLTEEYKAQLSSLPDSVSTRIHNAFVAGYHNATETLLGFLLFFEEYGPSLVIWLVVLALPIVLVWRRYKRVRSAI